MVVSGTMNPYETIDAVLDSSSPASPEVEGTLLMKGGSKGGYATATGVVQRRESSGAFKVVLESRLRGFAWGEIGAWTDADDEHNRPFNFAVNQGASYRYRLESGSVSVRVGLTG